MWDCAGTIQYPTPHQKQPNRRYRAGAPPAASRRTFAVAGPRGLITHAELHDGGLWEALNRSLAMAGCCKQIGDVV
jgi:hypothetical protein